MKKHKIKTKLARYFLSGIMLISFMIASIAQEIDTDVPMGWAVVPGYADSYDGVVTTTGGAGGEVVTVTSGSQLASYAGGTEPRIILIQGTLTGSDVTVGSNKTFLGVGTNAKLSGFYLNMSSSQNVIIRNLEITGGTDAIAARYTDHLWIDHCYLHSCSDGLIDITRESDRFSVTWCEFSDHHKTMLLNGGSTHLTDRGKINGTIHHNFFNGSASRNPRAGFGKIHIFNNFNYNNGTYGIGFHTESLVFAEKNYFKDMSDCIVQMYSTTSWERGDCLAEDNYFDNASGDESTGVGFDPNEYYMYNYLLDNAADVAGIVQAKVGPAAEYGEIGLMPTPGQGAVKVTDATLKWATGTVSPDSYIVYFGTTANPPQVATTTGTSYNASLSANTIYYWRVDQVTSSGTIPGKLWMFNTGTGIVPPTPVTGVTVAPTNGEVGIGGTIQLTETVVPATATNKAVTWSSSNTSIATVNSTGVVTGVSLGNVVITVTTDDGDFTATSSVTVKEIPATGVTVSPSSVTVGLDRTYQLTATVEPASASNKNVSWSSSNTAVASVSSSGLVTGISLGDAIITATTDDGGFTATASVTVTEISTPPALISLGFNENSGSSVANTGTVSATFTKTDPPSWSTNIPSNGGVSSVDFGTSTGNYYVESGAVVSELAGMSSFTVTGWVNNRSSSIGSGGNRIVSWINNGGNGVDIVYNSDGSLKVGINEWPDKTTAISSTGKIPTDANAAAENWRFFAVTYEASTSTLMMYFGDNTTAASLDKTFSYNKGNVGTDIGKLAIGHFNAESSRTSRTDRMFRGLIDQVDIFGSVLSLQDIQAVQNVGGATTIDVTGVSVEPSTATVNVGSTIQLSETVSPSDATNKNVTWSSSNTAIATVSSTGLVTGVAEGSATITVTTQDGSYTASSTITVNNVVVPVTGVAVSPITASVNVGSTIQLTETITPSNATNKNVTWSSSNTAIATVSAAGLVTGVAEGSTAITVTTQDGGFTATCNITVTVASEITLTIQENEDGFCSVDGSIDNNNAGFTGDGFANTDNSLNNGITWSVNIPSAGSYAIQWRYANGGSTDRTAQLMEDGTTIVSNISMPTTNSWTTWAESSVVNTDLSAGNKLIRLQATTSSGLANIDYIQITGNGISPVACSGLKSASIAGNSANINMYPNPTKGHLNFEFDNELSETVTICLHDLSGKPVKTMQTSEVNSSMDISELSGGLYIVKISGSNINIVKTLTKE